MKVLTQEAYLNALKAAEAARDAVPVSFNRKRERAYNGTLEQLLRSAAGVEISPADTLGKSYRVVYDYTVNLGNRKYPDILRSVLSVVWTVDRLTPCGICSGTGRLSVDRVLALVPVDA